MSIEVTVRNYVTGEAKVVRGRLRTFTAGHPFCALIVALVAGVVVGGWLF